MNVRLTCLAIAAVAAGSLFAARPAIALPNCSTCLRGYDSCVASGQTDCDSRYAVCLRYCPAPLASAPSPIKRIKPFDGVVDNKGDQALVAAR